MLFASVFVFSCAGFYILNDGRRNLVSTVQLYHPSFLYAYLAILVQSGIVQVNARQTDKRTNGQTNRQTDKLTNRQTDKQTNRQTDKQTNRQTDKQTNGQTGKQANRQTDRQTDKQTNRQTDKQTNRQTDKQTNKQTDKQTNRQTDNRQPQEKLSKLSVCAILTFRQRKGWGKT